MGLDIVVKWNAEEKQRHPGHLPLQFLRHNVLRATLFHDRTLTEKYISDTLELLLSLKALKNRSLLRLHLSEEYYEALTKEQIMDCIAVCIWIMNEGRTPEEIYFSG